MTQVIDCARVREAIQLYRVAPWHLLWEWRRRVNAANSFRELFAAAGQPFPGMFGCAFARPA